ncbi:MAG: hypothetical protein KDA94_01510 [Acidimicrobiales bacterium]|nr:hypothetical protein [Acidimicrobiales bacterium]
MREDQAVAIEDPSPHASKRRVLLERGWVVGVVLFTIARFFVAYGALDRYGVNIWMFGFIDIVTAVPYGVSTARVVGALVDRNYQSFSRWAFVAGATFLAPYLYLTWAGRDHAMPGVVYAVLALLCLLFGANAVLGVTKRVRERREATKGSPSADLVATAS